MKTKEGKVILIETLEKMSKEFHSQYIENNYHLRLANLTGFDKIDEAMILIKAEPLFFDSIPDGVVFHTKLVRGVLHKYDILASRAFSIFALTVTIEVGIRIGLSYL